MAIKNRGYIMSKTMDKIAKSKNTKSQPILHGTHITSNKIEVCDRHVAIIETFKAPVDTMTGELVLSPKGLPVVGNYPNLDRLMPLESYATLTIKGQALMDILKIKKGAEKAKLFTDDNETLRIKFDHESDSFAIGTLTGDFNETHFNPTYLLLMVEEVKETQGRMFKDNVFKVAWKHENEPMVMDCENEDINVKMLVTPLR